MSFADIDFTKILNLSTSSITVDLKESETEVSRPKRCQATDCRQKIKLTDSACKCKSFFCGVHRHAELHDCTFDYRQTTAVQLEKQLVKSQAVKFQRIE
jgi:predicted nucleic acid binding AN1-type Zn finger protein|uniref:AN1-type domain-containing protein n=1 Tax=viral metagenome TaxID=1070528 RepID=A0A6C0K7H4_9ZZZZ